MSVHLERKAVITMTELCWNIVIEWLSFCSHPVEYVTTLRKR